MASWKRLLVMMALVPALITFAAACGDDDNADVEGTTNASQSAVDQLTARVQRNELMAAAIKIDSIPLHEMSETIAEGTAEESFVPDTRLVVRIMSLTDWGPELQAGADEVRASSVRLLQALDAGDLEAAAAPADELHDGWHEFAQEVWGVLAADLPADAGGVPQAEEEEDEAPDAEATP